jgi:hypothetical protein
MIEMLPVLSVFSVPPCELLFKMKFKFTSALIVPFVVCLAGCLRGEWEVDTKKPSAKDLQHWRQEMFIQPNLQITPLHLKVEGFQDTVAWFSFIAHTDKVEDIFVPSAIDSTKFTNDPVVFNMDVEASQAGWNFQGKLVLGESFELPTSSDGMKVGIIDNGDQTKTVFVMWYDF